MRKGFAHEAAVSMTSDADIRALGAAVTLALCGDWEHEPPCPLAPHHTSSQHCGKEVEVTVLFATEPALETITRSRIEEALGSGALTGPDGVTTRWQLRRSHPRAPLPTEADHLGRLIRS